MKDDRRNHRTHTLGITEWSQRLVTQVGVIARDIHAELKRLNHGADYGMIRGSDCGRNQTRAFKAALVQRYQDHNGCC
jgi:hypothetical protein